MANLNFGRCRSILGGAVVLLFLTALALPAQTLLFSDNFTTYNPQNWGTQPTATQIDNGTLRISPPDGQVFISSGPKFKFTTFEARIKFNALSANSTIFYYLGFQSVIPWTQNLCWFTVQDTAIFGTCTRGDGTSVQQLLGNVVAGQFYTLKIEWSSSAVKFYVNGTQTFQMTTSDAIPVVDLPIFLSANTLDSTGQPADLSIDWVTITSNGGVTSADPVLISDDFSDYYSQDWSALPAGVSISNGMLHENPTHTQVYVNSTRKFRFATLQTRLRLNSLSTNSTIFYYIGFQTITPWVNEVCWVMVQDSVMLTGIKRADGGSSQQVIMDGIIAGSFYDIKIVWKAGTVEYWVNNALKYSTSDTNLIPQGDMHVFLGANALGTATVPANLDVDNATVSGTPADQTFAAQSVGSPDSSYAGISGSSLILENAVYRCQLSLSRGIRWDQLRNKTAAVDYLRSDNQTPLFMSQAGSALATSRDYQILNVQANDNGSSRNAVLSVWHSLSRLTGQLRVDVDATDTMRWSLKMQNVGPAAQSVQMVYPILGRVDIGNSVDANQYFFPWRSGIVGSANCDMAHEYGGLAWMQVVSLFNPQVNAGLYIYPQDATGEFKGMVFQKNSPAGNFIRFSENVQSLEYPKQPVLDWTDGTGLGYYYLTRTVGSQTEYTLPTTVLAVYQGNWKRALSDYSTWAHTWYNHVTTPTWFKRCFNYLCEHPAGYYSTTENKYIASQNHTYGTDIYQWAMWENYVERPDIPFIRGLAKFQPGDFQYNESRGGLEAFHTEIQALRQKGARFTVYIDHRFCWQETNTGMQYGAAWGAMYSPGEYGYYPIPSDKYCMCFYEPNAWAKYIADTCSRVMTDTGMDGIYLDELPLPFPCYNTTHTHYQANGSPLAMPQFLSNIQAARTAITSVNPQAILMTEHAGSDYASQFIDGSWSETFYKVGFPFAEPNYDSNSLNYFRFYFPEFTQAEWGESDDGPRRCFFNGMGSAGTGEPTYLRKTYQVMRENADAFNTLTPTPLVETRAANVLANKFPTAGKTVYTIYNKNTTALPNQEVIEVDAPANTHFVEMFYDQTPTVRFGSSPSTRKLVVNLNAQDVICIAVFPTILQCAQRNGLVTITLSQSVPGALLMAYMNEDTSYNGTGGKAVTLANGQGCLDTLTAFGYSGKVILKLYQDGILMDETMVQTAIATSSVKGKLVLSNFSGSLSMVGARLEFNNSAGEYYIRNALLDSTGAFTVGNAIPGTYDVSAKAYAHRHNTRSNLTLTTGLTDLGTFTLPGGDVNGDDNVTADDLVIVLSQLQ